MPEEVILAVWQKATPIDGYSPDEWRVDRNGNIIHFDEYGKTSQYGWEVEHSIPKVRGGSDELSNLYPMRWCENREKYNKTQSEYEFSKFIKNLRAVKSTLAA